MESVYSHVWLINIDTERLQLDQTSFYLRKKKKKKKKKPTSLLQVSQFRANNHNFASPET